jgi:hypothetical protein
VILWTHSKHGRQRASDLRRSLEGEPFVRPSIANDPEHWRKRAEEMRTLANEIKDPLSKETMLRIADDYERLAKRAHERANPGGHR